MESPQDQPQIIVNPTPSESSKKSKGFLIGLIILVVVIISGVSVALTHRFGFLQSLTPRAPQQSIQNTLASGVGYTKTNELYLEEERTGHYLDLDSFEPLVFANKLSLPTYGVDKNSDRTRLYFISKDGILSGGRKFDIDSFKASKTIIEDNSCGYKCRYDAMDKNSWYFKGAAYPLRLSQVADAETFSVIYTPDGSFSGLAKDKNNLYAPIAPFSTNKFYAINEHDSLIDLTSFEALGGEYFKDKNSVFHGGWPGLYRIENAELRSFHYNSDFGVAKDAEHVYLYGRTVSKADPGTFTVVYPYEYYKDKNYVFETGLNLSTRILGNADPSTFSYDFQTDIARDNNHVWVGSRRGFAGTLVPGVDSKTFAALNAVYYKDAHAIYYIYRYTDINPVPADIGSFKVYLKGYWKELEMNNSIGYVYAVDKNFVYSEGKVVPKADISTFTPISGPYSSNDSSYIYDAQDKNHKYKLGEIVQ